MWLSSQSTLYHQWIHMITMLWDQNCKKSQHSPETPYCDVCSQNSRIARQKSVSLEMNELTYFMFGFNIGLNAVYPSIQISQTPNSQSVSKIRNATINKIKTFIKIWFDIFDIADDCTGIRKEINVSQSSLSDAEIKVSPYQTACWQNNRVLMLIWPRTG